MHQRVYADKVIAFCCVLVDMIPNVIVPERQSNRVVLPRLTSSAHTALTNFLINGPVSRSHSKSLAHYLLYPPFPLK